MKNTIIIALALSVLMPILAFAVPPLVCEDNTGNIVGAKCTSRGSVNSAGPRIDPSTCVCVLAGTNGDGGTLGTTQAVDAGAANTKVLPSGHSVLTVSTDNPVSLAQNGPCTAYGTNGTFTVPEGSVLEWYAPPADAGTTTYYTTCSKSGTPLVCICGASPMP